MASDMAALLVKLTAAGTSDGDRKETAQQVADLVKEAGITILKATDLVEKLKKASLDKKNAGAKEGAMLAINALAVTVGKPVEPYLVPLLPNILALYADKVTVKAAAEKAATTIVSNVNIYAVKNLLSILFESLEAKHKWQTRVGALALIGSLAKIAPDQLANSLPEVVPTVSQYMSDAKVQVADAAVACMTDSCSVVGNIDIEPFVPSLISCIARPEEVSECVHGLAGTTFVQAVRAPTLSLMVPLLLRGLRERATTVKRQTCKIIDNMVQLVDDPADAECFLPMLLPGLEKASNEVADPEARTVAIKAFATLKRVSGHGKAEEQKFPSAAPKKVEQQVVLSLAKEATVKVGAAFAPSVEYVSSIITSMVAEQNFLYDHWKDQAVAPYLSPLMAETEVDNVCQKMLDKLLQETQGKKANDEDEDEGEDLCNCEFSLAYGAKILLNNAHLRLKRGRRYGLCGPNGAGKSTLMRAIANGQLEGFPPKEELRTVYVEHDIDASEAETPVVEFVFSDPALQGTSAPDHKTVEDTLTSVGFTEAMQQGPVAALSGGWKMKLALARAMLMKADIFLLDEPTNHLDTKNVAWIVEYLTHLPNVTSMIVSHDSGFLDNVCTDIIHYEGKKLRTYKGNLSEFVKVRPEAAAYYKLEAATQTFKLPEPGFLEGVKTKSKAILKMSKVGFTYPGTERKIISDVSIACSLLSRVAVIGPNGAGKSTMIKILTGELEPQDGMVWKHPNLRVAYVAQHAFHHIEQHLDKTPNEYIQWRYAIGEDRESLSKTHRQATEEEEKLMAKQHVIDGQKRVVEKILSRRKLKNSYEYEVRFVNGTPDDDVWMKRTELEDMGFTKLVNEIDMKEAARLGLHSKPLTKRGIEKHLEDVGIEPEVGSHTRMRGLSGGQKVKVVLAAAMWLNPHMLVLDEPTNYLDRESLGALAGAIREYGGGVVMISHNAEFTKELCGETWLMDAGKLSATGVPEYLTGQGDKVEWKREETMIDALGNEVKIKQPKKKLSRQELKKREKIRKAKLARGEEVSDSEDDE